MDERLGMGDKIGPALLQAIEKSKVRKQQKSYAVAFAQLEKRFEDNMDKVLMWRNALKEAADMSGFDNSKRTGAEADFIEKVAEDVLTKLNRTSSSSDSVELDAFRLRQIEEIESLLCIDSPGVCTVGIWGKISLKTVGDELFHRLSGQFEATCFLANVKEESKRQGLNHLRNVLLREILNEKDLSIDTPSVSPFIRERLSRTKVLIVLDDVNDSSQIEYLACGGHHKFGPGSRIIITTSERSLLKKTVHHDKIYKFSRKYRLISSAMKIGVSVRDRAAALAAPYVHQ
ncbi:PREDICTED: TMV resistance protein N-like [Prunus mume]|uniref:TMV resistance protein N-like n=1 Tax=Prunus mume TaxID=102107 RepID=A0ABM1LSS5_PRUMU|nr:PREDICTED: TMV resistance protein N-like [Prunus mume]